MADRPRSSDADADGRRGPGRRAIAEPFVGPQPVHVTDDARVIHLLQAMLRHNAEQIEELTRAEQEATDRAEAADRSAQQALADALRSKTDADLAEQRRRDATRRERVAAEEVAALTARVDELVRERDALQAEVTGLAGTVGSLRSTLDELRRAEAGRTRDALEGELAGAREALEQLEAGRAELEARTRRAEEARDRAQRGTARFQQMVEEARARELASGRAVESAEARAADARRLAAEATAQAEEATRLAAELERELAGREEGGATVHALQTELAAARAELTRLRHAHGEVSEHAESSAGHAADAAADRARLLDLSDAWLLRRLVRRADALWPAVPRHVAAYEEWLEEAQGLVLMLEEHRATHAALDRLETLLDDDRRARGWRLAPGGWDVLREAPPDDGRETTRRELRERVLASGHGAPADDGRAWTLPALRWWRDALAALVSGVDQLAAPGTGLLARVEARLETARTLEWSSLTGKAVARAWAECVEDLADAERCPAYGGLVLEPQLGLRPVGKDPATGLWEFAMPHTGAVPQRRADGRLPLDDDHAVVLVLVPGGVARLGAQAQDRDAPHHDLLARSNEGPVHEVPLAPFFLAKYAMTQAQWRRVMGDDPSRYPAGSRVGGVTQTPRHPVENVDWHACVEATRRLGLVLPTEAQWEYAARAGTGTPWWTGERRDDLVGAVNLGDQAARRAGATWAAIQDWLELDDGYTVHAPVDYDRPNPFGLHGVHGNVWEWCRDALLPYGVAARAGDGLREGSGAATRVFRGGGYRNTAAQARVSCRMGDVPEKRSSDLGLRPARPVDGPSHRGAPRATRMPRGAGRGGPLTPGSPFSPASLDESM